MIKPISETRALFKLEELRDSFTKMIRERYEAKAKPCDLCDSPGKCCQDEHYVNVRITRLEARAIGAAIQDLPSELIERVRDRTTRAISTFKLDQADANELKTFACPLFEAGIGCLVHNIAKPLPCIVHACYERREDLPPDELLENAESRIARLNARVYGDRSLPCPIPVAIRNWSRFISY
ncbi:hypothetical protein [Leptolyngbya sp. 7M]|uniref:hypothetical protein n=1 Tax=Leptolyngbya sp. 7M TaxID=2812896 RepID=UPI001B8D1085|nr:hypothetical protein [Leptolyngbya sp. 7M]QYO66213.1 hypothetical protein JVX88_05275 [Leptolyngbya sp. 7M]